jgi:hypothetical protein
MIPELSQVESVYFFNNSYSPPLGGEEVAEDIRNEY